MKDIWIFMKNSINLITLIGIFTALFAAPLFAAEDEKKKPAKKPTKSAAERFAKFDKNSDGSLSLDELKANPYFKDKPEIAARNFKRRDKDGDGKLSKEELLYCMDYANNGYGHVFEKLIRE